MSDRIKFQADADLRAAIVKGLRRIQPAIDIFDPHQGGLIGLLDPDVLAKSCTGWARARQPRCQYDDGPFC